MSSKQIILLLALGVVVACGQKGALYLPNESEKGRVLRSDPSPTATPPDQTKPDKMAPPISNMPPSSP